MQVEIMEEQKGKRKAEFKMFIWYIFTEPLRKLKYLFRTTDREFTPSTLLYVIATVTIFLFVRDWTDIKAWLGALVVTIVGLSIIWRRKLFIHQYRRYNYKKE